jgi:hypothetical protein
MQLFPGLSNQEIEGDGSFKVVCGLSALILRSDQGDLFSSANIV